MGVLDPCLKCVTNRPSQNDSQTFQMAQKWFHAMHCGQLLQKQTKKTLTLNDK